MWNPIAGRYECDHCGRNLSGETSYEITPLLSKHYALLCGSCTDKFLVLDDREAKLPGEIHRLKKFTHE